LPLIRFRFFAISPLMFSSRCFRLPLSPLADAWGHFRRTLFHYFRFFFIRF
jgi:hypothetical protein